MSSEKEWLDASIARWERVVELAEKRLKLYRDLRKQLDVDFADLKRLVDEDSAVSSAVQATVDSVGSKAQVDETESNPKKNVDTDREATSNSADIPLKATEFREVNRQVAEQMNATVDNDERQGEDERVQVRGERNPNRLLILELTTEQRLTVPQLQREMKARGQEISKQSVSNWVSKLITQGLLQQVPASDPAAKYAFQRTSKLDDESVEEGR